MTLILNKTLLRLGVYILSIEYLEDRAFYFTKVTEYDNSNFDCKVIEDENSEEDGIEAVTNSKENVSKKKA